MNLDPKKFTQNEVLSNHAVAAFVHPDCPVKDRMCFGVATGFGGVPVNICEFFKDDSTEATPDAKCLHPGTTGP